MSKVDSSLVLERPRYKTIEASDIHRLRGPVWVEPKLDGIWGQMLVTRNSVSIYSRHGQRKFYVEGNFTPVKGIIHGEFMYGSNYAIRKNLVGNFFAFDIVNEATEGLTYELRSGILTDTVHTLNEEVAFRATPVERTLVHNSAQVEALWKAWVLGQDKEGLVLKEERSLFGQGWTRIKRGFEVDYICIGFNEGTRRLTGTLGSMQAGLLVNGVVTHICDVSGFTDAQRDHIWSNKNLFTNRVFRASGKGLFPSGGLRHPNFVEWHQDKRAEDCTLESVLASRNENGD